MKAIEHEASQSVRYRRRRFPAVPDEVYEFQDLLAAIDEAKRVLAEMALDGMPKEAGSSIAVDVITSTGFVAARVGLTLSVDFPVQYSVARQI